MGGADKFIAGLVRELPDFLGLFFFFGAAYLSYFTFIGTDSPFVQLFFLAALISVLIIRTIAIVSNIIFSPSALSFRVLPIQCQKANIIHRLIVWTGGYLIVVMMFSVVTHRLGADQKTVLLLQLFFASLLLAGTALAVIVFRARISEQILGLTYENQQQAAWGRTQFAAVWHILALLYLFILWLLLINSMIDPETKNRGAFILSFFVLPIWMIADRIVQWVVQYAMSTLKIHREIYKDIGLISDGELEQRRKGRELYLKTRSVCRTALVFALAVWVASLWNIHIPFFSNLTAVLLDSLLIMTLALIFWQFISSWIERKIEESIPEGEENKDEQDDEWGSAAARGRSYTLLPMIRKFIATVLVVMVSMTILSSMGVDIGPLLAGAGVIGLAIGFGAQKLVADMFSGFFYLLDDAFRVGEYMTAGSVSGTVENITLRNVMLRHHRGMLQIIPHSELGAITNYMRGGIIVKFNLDFPYDANIDQIRKIIKKVGQAMLEDEELGKDFIRPVKSQGVREITNSVMTIRVKFTAKPGTHFVIRREAFKRITEALQAKGIQYAYKKVIVDLPQPSSDNGNCQPTREIYKAAGAAALAALEDAPKNGQPKPQNQLGPDM